MTIIIIIIFVGYGGYYDEYDYEGVCTCVLISECITRNTDFEWQWINILRGNWSMMTAEDESRHTRIGFIIISYSSSVSLPFYTHNDHLEPSLRAIV